MELASDPALFHCCRSVYYTERMASSTCTETRSKARMTNPQIQSQHSLLVEFWHRFMKSQEKDAISVLSNVHNMCNFSVGNINTNLTYVMLTIWWWWPKMLSKMILYPANMLEHDCHFHEIQKEQYWTESPRKASLKRWKTDPAITSWFEIGCRSESCQALTVVSQQFSNMRATGREYPRISSNAPNDTMYPGC